MSFQHPRSRRLSPDEQADLEGHQEMRGAFTVDELARFEAYCAGLCRLAELSGVVCNGVARVHPCHQRCGNSAPAGIPGGWVGSKWDACPACVKARRLVSVHQHGEPGALDRELLAYCVGDVQDEMRAFFDAIVKVGAR